MGDRYACPECGTAWRKVAVDEFVRELDGRQFVRRVRSHEGAGFPYLAATDGAEPITERCCARIILRHHQTIRPGEFLCPVCRTVWRKETRGRAGVSVPVFTRPGLPEPVAVQQGQPRSFLVPLATYTLPVE